MFRKLQAAATLSCMLSYAMASTYAMAGTDSIGTASARGDMRIDSYLVNGNATLFNGSVVETGQATAELRLEKGAEFTMSKGSRGTFYSDRLVLESGKGELVASKPFRLETMGLHVTANEPNSRGVVSMESGNIVQVAAITGSFLVTSGQGVPLASVSPGRAVSFALQAAGGPQEFEGVGMISYENGHYYLTTSEDVKYELVGRDFKKFVGTKSVISGNVQGSVISVKSIGINGPNVMTGAAKLFIAGVVVEGAAVVGLAVYFANQPTTPASP
jgi:hypothetical protein